MNNMFEFKYNEIHQYIKNDEFNNAFDEAVVVLQMFTDKYNNLDYDMNDFRSDCKYTFTIIQKVFEMDGDVLTDMYYDIEHEKNKEVKYLMIQEKNEYLVFINALKYIVDNIDDIDINSCNLHEQCSIIINYMNEKKKSSQEVINSLNELEDSLKKVKSVLQTLNNSTQK